ncbi:MAG: glycosyltransferase, partial [Candidatus Omnitrophica bacterium]|nr:glycosyltransferase [Candidatus Omnitrophota bacterium]
MNPVNIVCMKWGTKYGPEYVNILYNMVKRNITLPFRFICMTDIKEGINKEIEISALPGFREPAKEYLRYCRAWRKLALFDKEVLDLKGKLMFLDLDILILDNIDCFFTYSDKLAIIENWSQPGRLIGQASVFCFEIGGNYHLLEKYNNQHEEVLNKNETEQVYITRELGKGNFDYFPEDWCKSFKMHCMPGGILNS